MVGEDEEFEKMLGSGTFNEVYLARVKKPKCTCTSLTWGCERCMFAVKYAKFQGQLEREANLHSQISHTNIVKFACYKNGSIYMEPCSSDLSRLVQMCRPDRKGIGFQKASKLMKGILSGVMYLHTEMNIAHMDLKVENVLIDNDGRPKLCDFGGSSIMDELGNCFPITFSYTSAPPELAGINADMTQSVSGQAVDVWSLGVMFIYMLTGSYPWERAIEDCPEYDDWLTLPKSKGLSRLLNMRSSYGNYVISCMLEESPKSRPTCVQVLELLMN